MLNTQNTSDRFISLRRITGTVVLTAFAVTAGFVGGRANPSISAQGDPLTRMQAYAAMPLSIAGDRASYSEIVDKVAPSIATIRVEKTGPVMTAGGPDAFRDFFGRQFRDDSPPQRAPRQGGLGSGVIIRSDGYILTNNHVVDGATHVRVDLSDRRTLDATVVGVDEASDLAVLKVDASDLVAVPYGDSDQVKVGDVVLAFGNPLGIGQTVTMGIVGAKGRATGVGDGSYEDFIQTDAPINQGNSGGALVNMRGELVGINAQIVSTSGGSIGLGFAIPSGMVRAVTEQLIEGGVVHRAQLGVTVQTVTSDLAASLGLPRVEGAMVSAVEDGSPAAKAGVKQGDVIVGLEGHSVPDSNSLRNRIASTRPGTDVTLKVFRDGQEQQLTARLAERDDTTSADERRPTPPSGDDRSPLGLAVQPLTPQSADRLGVPRSTTGVVITGVVPDGPADEVGIQAGDIIVKANGKAVRTADDLKAAVGTNSDRPVLLLVTRDGTSLFVALKPQG